MSKEYIERGYPTCKDCFHWVACKAMLDAAGVIVSEDYAPDARRCNGFVPAADVLEVTHGRWEWREEWETHPEMRSCDLISCGWYCTECGIELGEYLTQKTGQHIILDDDSCKPRLTNCPNCGADMRGVPR